MMMRGDILQHPAEAAPAPPVEKRAQGGSRTEPSGVERHPDDVALDRKIGSIWRGALAAHLERDAVKGRDRKPLDREIVLCFPNEVFGW
jgi:hypothetical protein